MNGIYLAIFGINPPIMLFYMDSFRNRNVACFLRRWLTLGVHVILIVLYICAVYYAFKLNCFRKMDRLCNLST